MLSTPEWLVFGVVVTVILLFPFLGRMGDALGRFFERFEKPKQPAPPPKEPPKG